MRKPYRCWNARCATDRHGRLGFDFWAEAPVCPKCGADGDKAETAHTVIELAIVHFDPPHPIIEGRGKNHPACEPNARIGGQWRGTGATDAVTCPACKETPEYKAALDAAQPVLAHLKKWMEQGVAAPAAAAPAPPPAVETSPDAGGCCG